MRITWAAWAACAASLALKAAGAGGQELKAGVGRAVITPDTQPVWLAGYAARAVPSTGMIHHVWAKALVLEDSSGSRAALITADVLGLTREIIEVVARRLNGKYGLDRTNLFFNASHTHSGPVIWPKLSVCYEFSQSNLQHVVAQNRALGDRLVEAVDLAMTNLAPARLSVGFGEAGFAANRRKREVAPVDHAVPVLRVAAPDGRVRAVLFNYACHCTTLTASNLLINGDYAGFAALDLEAAFPGATALFVQGCAADQNPDPRHTAELARQHGAELASAVQTVLAGRMRDLRGPIKAAIDEAVLAFRPVDIEVFRRELLGSDVYRYRRAKIVLEAFNAGHPIRSIPYAVQALRFGDGPSLLFLSGEVVVDYALRAKRAYPKESLVVAGYSSEVQCYVPSLRVLREGGYEADESMIYYGLPGPFDETVEETVFSAVRKVMSAVGASESADP